ncbi:gamma-secretase subunit PEN-2-like [Corticium candelabrum]|uniref:gamma-secretase subunit PEN-2-like n=1 Tax=Corticium candelabrum TaxID=121492 RepID=UPI002E272A28|nr:gamma-secretase subunit PEN-2-like [Corticium candelabrum]
MATDLSKLSKEEKEKLCRTYFLAGLVFLPFMWLANVLWFFKLAFCGSEINKNIRRNVAMSFFGLCVWIIGWTTWIVIYQNNRASWGAVGDTISISTPKGEL